jgi:two-component system, chemotaxis family, sensor kinase CheA
MSESDIVKDFLVESYENLDRLDRELVDLEKNPDDGKALDSIFRTIHTIKGTCGFLGFSKLEAVAHVGENLLTQLRDRHLRLNPEITTALLSMVDAIRQMLSSVEASGQEGERDDNALIALLTRLQEPAQETKQISAKTEVPPSQPQNYPPVEHPPFEPGTSLGEILMQRAGVTEPQIANAIAIQKAGDPRHLGEILVEQHVVQPSALVDALHVQQAVRRQAESASDSTIRVDVGLLDKLMNLVGELVLARNQILQFTNRAKDTSFLATSQRLNLITTELQEGVMKTRMQPIGNIWSKFPRIVRDVATTCGKQIRIEMEGKETELDKTIIEAIKDPLTHIVRNSADHGIETPEQRSAAGKSPEGKILLRAYHEGGQVNIEISDDGAGLHADKIRMKALEKGLITQDQAAKISERDAVNLIFLPGFSTAEKITSVSGRGVGMDVVKTNIEKIGGTVDVHSRNGAGTTVRMKIPLTLAIIPALIVSSGGDRYAIPQISLLELVRLDGEHAKKSIELIQGTPVYRMRGRLLPLVYLNRELKIEREENDKENNKDPVAQAVSIVVLQADGRQFGLVVNDINDTEEIVVKPLSKQLKGVKIFAGSTIMGDGRVALILDVLGLAQAANVVGENRAQALAENETPVASAKNQKQTMLVFQCGEDGRMAMDLSLVARLEEFKPEVIEKGGGGHVVQYRGQIMPLVRISEALGMHANDDPKQAGPVQVVVYSEQGRSLGFVVEKILDIVEEEIVARQPFKRDGLLGSAVIQQRVTDLLDVRGLIRTTNPAFFEIEKQVEVRA